MKWLPNLLFLKSVRAANNGSESQPACHSLLENRVLRRQLPPATSSAPGEDGLWGVVILDAAVCRKLWVCLQTVRI